ncbi:hypothetical protein NESM_000220200 [Novymonas esmeraldas]|uniref:Integrase n=1 Tax=Novymonas esmeraldas TaxID=1808958 RepID=A0AAW0F789_9TRYP
MEGLWSSNTWSQMRSLWTRFSLFRDLYDMPLDQHAAALFVHSLSVSVQTKHTYARNLINIFRKLQISHAELTLMDTVLRARGALIPMQQARAMTRVDLLGICQVIGLPVSSWLILAWKTASRWDEIARLQADSFLSVTETEIVVYFGTETKTSRTKPFRPDLYCVIRGDGTPTLARTIAQKIRSTQKGEPLFPMSTARLRELLTPHGYSAHSVKRGAIMHLLSVLPEASPLLQLIPLIAKHAPQYPVLGSMTARYIEDQVMIARHLGTGQLTSLL